MSFKIPKKLPTFADLKGILAQTKQSDNSMYQTVQEIIERLTTYTEITNEKLAALSELISGNPNGIGGLKNSTFLTKDVEVVPLPHSVQVLAGSNIQFNDSLPNKRIISSTGGGGLSLIFEEHYEGNDLVIPGPPGAMGATGVSAAGTPGPPGEDGYCCDDLLGYGISGQVDRAHLPSTIAYEDEPNSFTGNNAFFGVNSFTSNPSTFSGGMNITVSALNLAVGQITFPAVQNPSVGVNVLDDYEEGTWTPVDGSGAGLVLASVIGQYVKIGKMVYFAFQCVYPVTADGSVAKVGGLPFVNSAGATIWGAHPTFTNMPGSVIGIVFNGSSDVSLYPPAGGAYTNVGLSNTVMVMSGQYAVS